MKYRVFIDKFILCSLANPYYTQRNQNFPFISKRYAHFGFQTVSDEEKAYRVNKVFSNVAQKYDLMNDAMSAGIHRLWKNYFVAQLPDSSSLLSKINILDVAGGTGDIASRMVQKYGNLADVTILDINQEMLNYSKKCRLKNDQVNFVLGDAEMLPFKDNQFDIYTIAFGIRNCVHIEKVIDEALRVLKVGGRFYCLEFSQFRAIWPINQLYEWYSMNVIPVMGELIADDFKSYKYLVESIRQFPNQEQFCNLIESRGFSNVRYDNLSCGIATISSGSKA